MSINWASKETGAHLVDFSSNVHGCDAENVLDDNLNRIWLSEEGLPQWLCISFENLAKPIKRDLIIRTLGWYVWHKYTTNPRIVQIHVSSDGSKFKLWDTFHATYWDGIQLFSCAPISIFMYPYIAIEITNTFGGEQTYLNRVYMHSDEIASSPHVSMDESLSNISIESEARKGIQQNTRNILPTPMMVQGRIDHPIPSVLMKSLRQVNGSQDMVMHSYDSTASMSSDNSNNSTTVGVGTNTVAATVTANTNTNTATTRITSKVPDIGETISMRSDSSDNLLEDSFNDIFIQSPIRSPIRYSTRPTPLNDQQNSKNRYSDVSTYIDSNIITSTSTSKLKTSTSIQTNQLPIHVTDSSSQTKNPSVEVATITEFPFHGSYLVNKSTSTDHDQVHLVNQSNPSNSSNVQSSFSANTIMSEDSLKDIPISFSSSNNSNSNTISKVGPSIIETLHPSKTRSISSSLENERNMSALEETVIVTKLVEAVDIIDKVVHKLADKTVEISDLYSSASKSSRKDNLGDSKVDESTSYEQFRSTESHSSFPKRNQDDSIDFKQPPSRFFDSKLQSDDDNNNKDDDDDNDHHHYHKISPRTKWLNDFESSRSKRSYIQTKPKVSVKQKQPNQQYPSTISYLLESEDDSDVPSSPYQQFQSNRDDDYKKLVYSENRYHRNKGMSRKDIDYEENEELIRTIQLKQSEQLIAYFEGRYDNRETSYISQTMIETTQSLFDAICKREEIYNHHQRADAEERFFRQKISKLRLLSRELRDELG